MIAACTCEDGPVTPPKRTPAAAHWALGEEFCGVFPLVWLHPEHLLIDDHDIITIGGVMGWVDLGLALV